MLVWAMTCAASRGAPHSLGSSVVWIGTTDEWRTFDAYAGESGDGAALLLVGRSR